MDERVKKIGIVTIVDYDNYGNRLQNYALSKYLELKGFEAITIKNKPPKLELTLIDKFKKNYGNLWNLVFSKIWNKIQRHRFSAYINIRRNKFVEFTRRYIKETDFIVYGNDIPSDLSESFDYFCVGSDQIWNGNFRHGSQLDLLNFTNRDKKISVSASFGTYKIAERFEKVYSESIRDFKAISVREEAGVQIVKDLTGRDAKLVLDPTMAISEDHWLEFCTPHQFKPKNKPYILVYFLGGGRKKVNQFLKEINKDSKYEEINLVDYKQSRYYDVDPSEFIDLIKDAALFVTDSFHGIVFSILFKTPFVSVDRKDMNGTLSMNSRIDTVVNYFRFKPRTLSSISGDPFIMDFSSVQDVLEVKRKEYDDFINESFDLI